MSVLLRLSEERFGSEMGNIRNWWRQFFLKGTLIFNFKVAADLGWNVDAVTKNRQQAQHNFFLSFWVCCSCSYSLTTTAAVACVSGQSGHPNVIIKLERFAAGSKCFSSFLLLDCLFYSSSTIWGQNFFWNRIWNSNFPIFLKLFVFPFQCLSCSTIKSNYFCAKYWPFTIVKLQ